MSDFNVVRKQDCEKTRRDNRMSTLGSYEKEMKEFNEFIENMKLFNIPMIGRRYTWYKINGRLNQEHCKLYALKIVLKMAGKIILNNPSVD